MPMPLIALDDRFTTEEMMAATELQETATAKLQERIAKQHKLLVTHYNRPVAVLLELEAFTGLVERIRELEEQVEDLEASRFAADRLSEGVPEDQWLSQEDFAESIKRLILEFSGAQRGGE